jgi:hypothetical protein
MERHPSLVAVHGCIMAVVKKGEDQQAIHEKIRVWHGSLRASNQLATLTE